MRARKPSPRRRLLTSSRAISTNIGSLRVAGNSNGAHADPRVDYRPSWVPRHRSPQHNSMERSTLAVWKRSTEGRGWPDGYLRGKTTCGDIEWVYETRRSQVG